MPLPRARAGRFLLALVFMLGALASVSNRPYEVEGELTVECGEEGEPLTSYGPQARVVTRDGPDGGGPGHQPLVRPSVPYQLACTAPNPPRPRWLRPRRVPPPDDDPIA